MADQQQPTAPAKVAGPTIALRYVALAVLVAFALGIVCGVVGRGKLYPCVVLPTISVQRDTVFHRDTIQGKIYPPVIRTVIRRDTLRLQGSPDTTYKEGDTSHKAYALPGGGISVPIERRTYVTDDYRAVISGWHPSLDSIKLYPKSYTITNTVTKLYTPRQNWALVIGPSIGYGTTKAPIFGASAVFGFVVKSWH